MKRFSMILLCLLLIANSAATVFAAGSVTYDGDAKEFIFAPGSDHSPTDLFEDLKNVMPGDKITEEIVIKNDTSKETKIKVYMRSLGAQEGTDEFLSNLSLTVTQKDESILFQAPADQTAQLSDWVYLGTVYSGGEITLEVTLDVPISMGNDFQNQIGYIDWEFKIEELPIDPEDPRPPQTGDNTDLILYFGLMFVSLVALIALLIAGRRKNRQV